MIGKPIYIGEGSILDAPRRPLIDYEYSKTITKESVFGENVWIGSNCVVGKSVVFKDGVILSDGSYVEDNVTIGKNTLLNYRCMVCANSIIKENCVIGGFIGENTKIGEFCQVFGDIIHRHLDPKKDWDAPSSLEEGAILLKNVFIGFGAKVTRPVTINSNVYICPNTIVSVDVPPFHVVKGVNELVPSDKWKGELAFSEFFQKDNLI